MWQNLDRSQIIPTNHVFNAFDSQQTPVLPEQPPGLLDDLQNIEIAKNKVLIFLLPFKLLWTQFQGIFFSPQSYSLTLAFSRLVLTLLHTGHSPSHLGRGHTQPSMMPYFKFLFENVFLLLDKWPYESPAEKWQLTETILAVFCEFLDVLQVDLEHGGFGGSGPASEIAAGRDQRFYMDRGRDAVRGVGGGQAGMGRRTAFGGNMEAEGIRGDNAGLEMSPGFKLMVEMLRSGSDFFSRLVAVVQVTSPSFAKLLKLTNSIHQGCAPELQPT